MMLTQNLAAVSSNGSEEGQKSWFVQTGDGLGINDSQPTRAIYALVAA